MIDRSQWGSKPNEKLRNGFARSMSFESVQPSKALSFKINNTPDTETIWPTKFEYKLVYDQLHIWTC